MRMRRMVRTIAYVLVAAGFMYSSLATYARWKAYRARKDAEILLSEVRNLHPQESTLADVERLARAHGSFLVTNSPSTKGNALYFDFEYDNGLLSQLRLAPRTGFGVRLQVVDSKYDGSIIAMAAGKFPYHYSANLSDFSQQSYPGDPGYRFGRRDRFVFVHLLSSATPEQRKQAYSFDLKCLDKIGGCHDAKELLPGPCETTK